jgi:23S rRNA (adenine2503-C2)-methyltransferase
VAPITPTDASAAARRTPAATQLLAQPLLVVPEDDPALLGLDRPGRLEQCFRLIHGRNPPEVAARTRAAAARAGRLKTQVTRTVRGTDGTTKLQISLADGCMVESVLLRDARPSGSARFTACLSTQVGCAVGCRFCRTGRMGLHRNLSGQEIMEQYLHLQRRFGGVSNVVFMGMGEPLHNMEAVLAAVRVLGHPLGPAISLNRITISTSGAARAIERLAETERFTPRAGGRPRLAISLITARPEVRSRLIPTARRQDGEPAAALADLRAAVAAYQGRTGHPTTFEVVLMEGVTDTDEDARALIAFLQGNPGPMAVASTGGHSAGGAANYAINHVPDEPADARRPLRGDVNLIAWNPVDDLTFQAPSRERVDRFAGILVDAGIVVTCRFPRGTRTGAGCGQLGTTV